MKKCRKCGEEKPLTSEYFRIRKENRDGFSGKCKGCISEEKKEWDNKNKEHVLGYAKTHREDNKEYYSDYNKQYYQNNKEHLQQYAKGHRDKNIQYYKKYDKDYYIKNREKKLLYQLQYYKENPDYNKQYYQNNKERISEYSQIYYKNNRELIRRRCRKWDKANPDKVRKHTHMYRARKNKLPHTLTIEQWGEIKKHFNGECAYCGVNEETHLKIFGSQLHQEHFIPLTKGGGYTHNNIIPACKSCNSSKQSKDFFEWYPTYEHYNKIREKKILEYLGYKDENIQQLSIL